MLLVTLRSILSQIQEGVEIVISDNASLDGTQEAVEELMQQHPCIHYARFKQSVPCGENLMYVVSMARGKFCWLMTDDDKLEAYALQEVLVFLENHPGITGCSVNVQGYTKDMQVKKNIFYSHSLTKDMLFRCPHAFFSSLGAWCGFWSAQIVNKELWQQALCDMRYKEYEGYHHLFLIASMVHRNPYWGYLQKRLVGYRSDNESFTQEYGRVKRMSIDLYAYNGVGKTFFSKQATHRVNSMVLRSLLFWQLARAKMQGLSCKNISTLFNLCRPFYVNSLFFWCAFVPLLLTPRCILNFLRPLFKLLRRWL
jgi:glycosyltransferase involved in cell wall biosynthesis